MSNRKIAVVLLFASILTLALLWYTYEVMEAVTEEILLDETSVTGD